MTATASTTQTRTVTTSEIRVGDTVRSHGMRIHIDTIKEYEPYGAKDTKAWACYGTVLNLDEVKAAEIVPMSWLRTTKWVDGQGWVTDRDNQWRVQGNDLARWHVEIPPAADLATLREGNAIRVSGAFAPFIAVVTRELADDGLVLAVRDVPAGADARAKARACVLLSIGAVSAGLLRVELIPA